MIRMEPKLSEQYERKGGWTNTFTGMHFWPIDPRPEEIVIEDIAHGLALMNRYNGQTPKPYSVAQHSVIVSEACDPKDALWGLLHDASEAYIADIVKPAKQFMPEYQEIERNLMLAVCRKFWLNPVQPDSVTLADKRVLAAEVRDIHGKDARMWRIMETPIDRKIKPLQWHQAEKMFLSRFKKLWPLHQMEVYEKLKKLNPTESFHL